jgi:hypothetical protein
MEHAMSLSDSDRRRFLDGLSIGFTMFCDDHALSVGEGEELAASAEDEIYAAAEDRVNNPAVP